MHRLFGLVAGHVQQVVAGVRHGQVVLLGRGGLDDDAQALHAVDGDPVAARQEHCSARERFQKEKWCSWDLLGCGSAFVVSCPTVKSIIRSGKGE